MRIGGVLLIALLGCRSELLPAPGNDRVVAVYVENTGFRVPRGIVYDSLADVYLVSNASAASEVGGKGFISRITPNGNVADLRWISDQSNARLDRPEGLAIRGDTLFVSDVKCVRLFHRVTRASMGQICPAGAVSMSGIAATDSIIYIIDTPSASGDGIGLTALPLTSNSSSAITQFDVFRPSGVAAGPWGVFVTTHGVDQVVQLTPEAPRTVIRGVPKELGGVVGTRTGSFAFSNATDSTVLFVEVELQKGTGAIWTLASGLSQPGHLGYDSRRDRVLIPEAGRNRLILIDLR